MTQTLDVAQFPAVWHDLTGQSASVAQLHRAAQQEAPTHAWLFTGPPGSGRSTAARAFAQALQCENPDPAQRGCSICPTCLTIASGTHPDVKVMATEKVNYGIDEIRDLIGLAQDRPATARWRIFIMEDADRMTERATNVLLKAIEEPPPRTIWMLCAPSPADVLITIRSRTRKISLTIPSAESVARLLTERDGLDPEMALFAARASQSHVGVARWLASNPEARARREQIVSLPLRVGSTSQAMAEAADLIQITQQEATASAEERNTAERVRLLHSLGLSEDDTVPPKLRHHVKRLEEEQTARNRRSVHDALDKAMIDLIGLFRDVLAVQLGTDAELINEHLRDQIIGYARQGTSQHTLAAIDAIGQARTRLTSNVPPQLAVEAMLLAFVPRR